MPGKNLYRAMRHAGTQRRCIHFTYRSAWGCSSRSTHLYPSCDQRKTVCFSEMLARHKGQTLRISEHCGHVAICMHGKVTCTRVPTASREQAGRVIYSSLPCKVKSGVPKQAEALAFRISWVGASVCLVDLGQIDAFAKTRSTALRPAGFREGI